MLKTAITWLEHEILFHKAVLEDLNHVENIEVVLLGEDQSVPHQSFHTCLVVTLTEVVVGVGSVDLVVMLIL